MDLKISSAANSRATGSSVQGIAELQGIAPPGNILALRVAASQPIPTGDLPVKTLFEVIFSRGGQDYQVTSNRAFIPGDIVKVQISEAGTLQLLEIVKPPPVITPQMALQQGLREALPLQQSPTLLLNNLSALIAAIDSQSIAPQLQPFYRQINTLLRQQPKLQQLSNPQAIKQAFEASGSLLEAKLVAALKSIQRSHPQLKTTEQLIQLIRHQPQLQAQLQTLTATDLKAQLLKLVKNLAPHAVRQAIKTAADRGQSTTIAAPASPTKPGIANQPAARVLHLSRATALYQNFLPPSQNTEPQPTVSGTIVQRPTAVSATTLVAGHQGATTSQGIRQTSNEFLPGIKTDPPTAQFPQTSASRGAVELSASQKPTTNTAPNGAGQRANKSAQQKSAVQPAHATQIPPASVRKNLSPAVNPSSISQATNAVIPTTTNESKMLSRIITTALAMATGSKGGTQPKAEPPLPQPLLFPNLPIDTGIKTLFPTNAGNAARPAATDSLDLAISVILRQIAAGLSRIQAQQLNNLGGKQAGTEGTASQSWNLEIPVYTEGQFRPIQLQIEEERGAERQSALKKERKWKITLGFDFEALGKFYATLKVVGASISTTFWSETPATLKKIQGELNHLKKTLANKGLQVEQLDCRHGTPAVQQTRLEQQLLDIKT